MRRRKVELAATVFVVCALFGALLFSLREGRIAEHERHVAQQHFDSVRKLANTMLLQLHDEMAKDAGSLKSREMLVKTSLEYLDALYKKAGRTRCCRRNLPTRTSRWRSIQGNERTVQPGNFQERCTAMRAPLPCSRR